MASLTDTACAQVVFPDGRVHALNGEILNLGRDHVLAEGSNADQFLSIGADKTISRHHATLVYSAPTQAWYFQVIGKAGATVNGSIITAGGAVQLISLSKVQVGGSTFFVVMPARDTPVIAE